MNKMIMIAFVLMNISNEDIAMGNLYSEVCKLVSSPNVGDSKDLYEIRKRIMNSESEGIKVLNKVIDEYDIRKISRDAAIQITSIYMNANNNDSNNRLMNWYLWYSDTEIGRHSGDRLRDMRIEKLNINATKEMVNELKCNIINNTIYDAITSAIILAKICYNLASDDMICVIDRMWKELNTSDLKSKYNIAGMLTAIRYCGGEYIEELRSYSNKTTDSFNKQWLLIARGYAGDCEVKEDILYIIKNDNDYRMRSICIDAIETLYKKQSDEILKELYNSKSDDGNDGIKSMNDPKDGFYNQLRCKLQYK